MFDDHFPLTTGGLFDGASVEAETVFKYATRKVRRDRNVVQIEGSTKKVIYGNEFDVAQKVCRMIEVSSNLPTNFSSASGSH